MFIYNNLRQFFFVVVFLSKYSQKASFGHSSGPRPTANNSVRSEFQLDTKNRGQDYSKGHITKVYSIKGGGLKNLHGFRLIGVRCFVFVCIQLNPIRRNPCKFFSPPPK